MEIMDILDIDIDIPDIQMYRFNTNLCFMPLVFMPRKDFIPSSLLENVICYVILFLGGWLNAETIHSLF